MSRTTALCFEHRPVQWEVTASVTSCLFSCPSLGGGGRRRHFVLIESGGLCFTQYTEYKGEGQLPSLVWVGKVWYNIIPLGFENVCDAVWLLLASQKAVKTEFHRVFFFLLFKGMKVS